MKIFNLDDIEELEDEPTFEKFKKRKRDDSPAKKEKEKEQLKNKRKQFKNS